MQRTFVVTGLLTAVAVASLSAALSSVEVREDLLEEGERSAVLVARHLDQELRGRFGTLIPTPAQASFEQLDTLLTEQVAEFEILAVYVFDPSGRVVYSERPDEIGRMVEDNDDFEHAVEGRVASDLVERGHPLDISRRAEPVTLLETYVPISAPGGGLAGVIEIYQDATALVAETRAASLRVAAISTAGIVILMLALWLWINKADRIIRERTAALVRANDQLATLSADLEQQVDDRTRRLVRAETLASLATLGAGVAHEVNNPVAAIASCAEGLLRRAKHDELKGLPAFEPFPEYLEIIRDEAFRVKAITQNLLDFSRTSGDSAPRERVDLHMVLDGVARLFEHRAASEEKQIAIDMPQGETFEVVGDGAGLRQLVLNVTVNALDASPPGGVVRWTATRTGDGVELRCTDQGAGFPPEALGRALEPFFSTKPTGEGTGLGLSIAYAAATRHGGSLELENDPAGGARVRVQLPKGDPLGTRRAARPELTVG